MQFFLLLSAQALGFTIQKGLCLKLRELGVRDLQARVVCVCVLTLEKGIIKNAVTDW